MWTEAGGRCGDGTRDVLFGLLCFLSAMARSFSHPRLEVRVGIRVGAAFRAEEKALACLLRLAQWSMG
jgi:hypothetical protein